MNVQVLGGTAAELSWREKVAVARCPLSVAVVVVVVVVAPLRHIHTSPTTDLDKTEYTATLQQRCAEARHVIYTAPSYCILRWCGGVRQVWFWEVFWFVSSRCCGRQTTIQTCMTSTIVILK